MRASRGFTLVELAVALAIGGLVLVSARGVFEAVTQGAIGLTEARQAADARANARRLLSAAIGSIDVVSPGARAFRGDAHSIEFSTWIARRGTRPVLQRARLAGDRNGVALWLGEELVVLWPDADALDVDYLLSAGANEAWASRWESSLSAPVGVRLRIERSLAVDTLLLFVGPRG